MRKPTIYEIKRATAETSPYFFSRETLKFFGQTMKSFRVTRCTDGRFYFYASRKTGGYTRRFFNPANNKLEIVGL
jgi:hypothetical protein